MVKPEVKILKVVPAHLTLPSGNELDEADGIIRNRTPTQVFQDMLGDGWTYGGPMGINAQAYELMFFRWPKATEE